MNSNVDTNRKAISEVMTRSVCQVSADCPVPDTLALMRGKSVSSVLIVEDDLILGIVTERDFVRALHQNSALNGLTCADLMHSPVVTVTATTTCLDAYHEMVERGIRHLVVADDAGHVLGIASEGDLMRDFGIEYYMKFKSVGGVMATEVCLLPPTASIAEAVAQMAEKRQSCIFAVDADGHPVGILTERDIVRLCHEQEHPQTLTLAETMRGPVSAVTKYHLLHEAVQSMEAAHIRRLAVVNEAGAVCGLLTHHEIVRALEGEYVGYLREVVQMQAQDLRNAARVIDEKLLLANILRSATGTAVLAADLSFRVSYCTPAVAEVLGLAAPAIHGKDLREILEGLGWADCRAVLDAAALQAGAQQQTLATGAPIDLQVSLLIDEDDRAQGYLILAQKA